jgi:DNA-binding NarL/FixJ family response regulator
VGVIDEQEIFRRGVVASLADDPLLTVCEGSADSRMPDLDVAIVSAVVAAEVALACPLILLLADEASAHRHPFDGQVVAALRRTSLTAEQLVATVWAVAAGLRVEAETPKPPAPHPLNGCRRDVLRMLAEGADTKSIADSLCYSPRTIKTYIQEIQQQLRVKTRAQAVAEGIQRGWI